MRSDPLVLPRSAWKISGNEKTAVIGRRREPYCVERSKVPEGLASWPSAVGAEIF